MDEDDEIEPALAVERDELLAELRRVFPARRPKPFPPLVDPSSSSSDATRAAAAFADATDWTLLDADWLHGVPNAPNGVTEARCFLSAAALCFYLPAYLTAALRLELDPMFSLTHGFDARSRDKLIHKARPERGTWSENARACWAGLTPGQVGVIARFMAWRVALNGPVWDSNAVEALAFYWQPRAAMA